MDNDTQTQPVLLSTDRTQQAGDRLRPLMNGVEHAEPQVSAVEVLIGDVQQKQLNLEPLQKSSAQHAAQPPLQQQPQQSIQPAQQTNNTEQQQAYAVNAAEEGNHSMPGLQQQHLQRQGGCHLIPVPLSLHHHHQQQQCTHTATQPAQQQPSAAGNIAHQAATDAGQPPGHQPAPAKPDVVAVQADQPASSAPVAQMCHVLEDNGRINLGGGISFKIPMWYDDLAKTGLVPR